MELGKRIERMTKLLEGILEVIQHIDKQMSVYVLSILLKENVIEPLPPEDYE